MNISEERRMKGVAFIVVLLGILLWGSLARQLSSEGKLSFVPNIACLKGSPYGKVFALAMQGPVGVYFHGGDTHKVAEALGDESGHDHPQDDGRGEEHADGCGCGAHDHEEAQQAEVASSLRSRAKKQLKRMGAYAQRKNDGGAITEMHKKYLEGVTEDKLKLAYEFDPSNYTNYGNYHLYLSMSSLGRSAADEEAAVALAYRTLEFCKKEQDDAVSWLTAASAAYNIITHIGRHYEEFTVAQAKSSLAEFDECMRQHQVLLAASLDKGFVFSDARLAEMKERVRFLTKLRVAQGVHMKRMMSRQEQ